MPGRRGRDPIRTMGRCAAGTFLRGGALGAGLAYFFDPDRGRRRRRVAHDRMLAAGRHGGKRIARRAHRTAAYGQGLLRRFRHLLWAEPKPPPDDATLVDRVESVIFRNPAVPKGRFNVNADRGVVFLRGEIETAKQIEAIVEATRRVPGVREVRSLLHLPGTSAPHT
jgi:hypothetical protein